MTAALENWRDRFSDLPLFGNANRQDGNHPGGLIDDDKDVFQLQVAYYVKVGKVAVVKSEYNGDVQLEVDYVAEGFRPKKVWLTLPMQESDLAREESQVVWITQKRMKEIARLFSAALPSMYALYDVKQIRGMEKVFVGIDGKDMSNEDFVARKAVTQQNLTEAVKDLHGRVGQQVREVEGTMLYMVINPNPKRPKYPYVNIYRQPPLNIVLWRKPEYAPIHIDAEEGPVPF